jgi:hypothetical protein
VVVGKRMRWRAYRTHSSRTVLIGWESKEFVILSKLYKKKKREKEKTVR